MAKLTVLGIGNILMSDDGVGVRVMEAVRDAREWGQDVEFIDGGAGGLGLLNVIEDAQAMIVFDAADMGLSAGQFRVITPEQASADTQGRISMHDAPFLETLALCEQFFRRPEEVLILAIQPKIVDFGRGFSDELTAAFDGIVGVAEGLVSSKSAG